MTVDHFALSVAHLLPAPTALLAAVDAYREALADIDETPYIDSCPPPHLMQRAEQTESEIRSLVNDLDAQPGYPDEWRPRQL